MQATLLDQDAGAIRQVSGDGADDTRACHESALERDAILTIPPRRNAGVQERCRQRLAGDAQCYLAADQESRASRAALKEWLESCNTVAQDQ